MNEDSGPFQQFLEDIKQHFGFLFDRGYEIHSIKDSEDVRQPARVVMLKKEDLYLEMYHEPSWYELYFGSPSKDFSKIRSIIYFLSDEKDVLGNSPASMERDANLIRKYIDEIESIFRDDYSGFWEGREEQFARAHWKYEGFFDKSLPWLILAIPYILLVVVFFKILDELLFGWLLSGWFANLGYSSSSWLIRGISLLLAVGSAYIIYKAIERQDNETKFVLASTDQIPQKKSIAVTLIRFLIFWIAYILIMFVLSVYLPISTRFETIVVISEVLIGFLLAAWTVRKIADR
jgi:hypothetical protein